LLNLDTAFCLRLWLLLSNLFLFNNNTCAAVDENTARQAGATAVKAVIPRKIDYKKLNFSLMPFGVKVNDITFSENERFAKHPLRDWPFFARADEVSLTAELLPFHKSYSNLPMIDLMLISCFTELVSRFVLPLNARAKLSTSCYR
jgi:hypothetical protein